MKKKPVKVEVIHNGKSMTFGQYKKIRKQEMFIEQHKESLKKIIKDNPSLKLKHKK